MQRFLYITPDNPSPAGGVRVIYRHVQTLNRHDIPAFVVHNQLNFKPTWFQSPTEIPTLYLQNRPEISPHDILIVPEVHASELKTVLHIPAKKIILCQNHFIIFEGLKDGSSWQSLGVTHAIATSTTIANFIQTVLKFPNLSRIQLAIDHTLFHPAPQKKPQIAVMPRKMPSAFQFIRHAYNCLAGPDALPFVVIEKMPERQAASILGESSIFLSLSWLEGLGLPPLEAMAAGCIVTGFHGTGGQEYATPKNALWCEPDNWLAAAHALHTITTQLKANDPHLAAMTAAAQQTAAQYKSPTEEKDLLNLARTLLSPPNP